MLKYRQKDCPPVRRH